MTLLGLAGLLLVSLVGPALSSIPRARVPIVVGELAAGAVIGASGLRWAHPTDRVFTFLAQAGFALVMMVAGSHVPVRDPRLRAALTRGVGLALVIAALSVPAAYGLSHLAGSGHTGVYAVVLASSSAALVMPVVDADRLEGEAVLVLLAQVVAADTACIVALPLVSDPHHASRAAVGALVVIAVAAGLFGVLMLLERRGILTQVHRRSIEGTFGLEMRLSLLLLFALAGLAVQVHVSVMLAGFCAGLVLAAIGAPRRLAGQLFGVTEGFLGPVFFLWLGATIDLRALVSHPKLLLLALGLAAATLLLHALAGLAGQPLPLALLAAAQLGVPVAAVTLGTQNGTLHAGEGAAILAAALVTIAVASAAGTLAARRPTITPNPAPTA